MLSVTTERGWDRGHRRAAGDEPLAPPAPALISEGPADTHRTLPILTAPSPLYAPESAVGGPPCIWKGRHPLSAVRGTQAQLDNRVNSWGALCKPASSVHTWQIPGAGSHSKSCWCLKPACDSGQGAKGPAWRGLRKSVHQDISMWGAASTWGHTGMLTTKERACRRWSWGPSLAISVPVTPVSNSWWLGPGGRPQSQSHRVKRFPRVSPKVLSPEESRPRHDFAFHSTAFGAGWEVTRPCPWP